MEYGGDEDFAIAALLHDSAEDQGGKARVEDVRNRFGDRVARVVAGCSDSLADTTKGEKKATGQERKEAYLAHLESADEDTLRVSLADKAHNARAICGSLTWGRRSIPVSINRGTRPSGIIAPSPTSSARDCPGSWLTSYTRSSRPWSRAVEVSSPMPLWRVAAWTTPRVMAVVVATRAKWVDVHPSRQLDFREQNGPVGPSHSRLPDREGTSILAPKPKLEARHPSPLLCLGAAGPA